MNRTFIDRESQFPNRRKITILQQNANEIIADITFADNPLPNKSGTKINAAILKDFQDGINEANSTSQQAKNAADAANETSADALKIAGETTTIASNAVTTANQAKEAATTATGTADTASSTATRAENKADDAIQTASDAIKAANTASSTADIASGVADLANEKADDALYKAGKAVEKADQAVKDSGIALDKAKTAETNSSKAKEIAQRVEQAVADRGATIIVGTTPQSSVTFTSDPQSQINNKLNKNFASYTAKTALAKTDTFVIQDSQTNDNKKVVLSTIFNLIYPIGSIYFSVKNTNPSTLFGGTWVAWGAGRVPVGMGNNNETNYTTVEATGGSENSVASHNHTQNAHTHIANAHNHTFTGSEGCFWNVAGSEYGANGGFTYEGGAGSYGKGGSYSTPLALFRYTPQGSNASATVTLQNSTPTNNASGTKGGNRQPYITCYMWKRTA